MPWYYGCFIGGIALATMNTILKNLSITAFNLICILPLLIIVQLGFWYAFKNGSNFVAVWFTGSAMSATSAVIISLLYFKEPFRWQVAVGMVCIIIGQFLLAQH